MSHEEQPSVSPSYSREELLEVLKKNHISITRCPMCESRDGMDIWDGDLEQNGFNIVYIVCKICGHLNQFAWNILREKKS